MFFPGQKRCRLLASVVLSRWFSSFYQGSGSGSMWTVIDAYVEKEGLRTLFWHDDLHTFYLIGKVDEETIVRMAESLKLKKQFLM
ncbi:hypothetical protein [Anoxynatronum buryatiense]|uniref:hypothetical protein n=1 Tax=Anoxynatronum buryatiense TaxID=489973 RepID=UPI0024B67147|nr:hypothetical protein [Anoxynatronum buryatiense]